MKAGLSGRLGLTVNQPFEQILTKILSNVTVYRGRLYEALFTRNLLIVVVKDVRKIYHQLPL